MPPTTSGIYEHFLDLLTADSDTRPGRDGGGNSQRARYGEGSGPSGELRPYFLTRDDWVLNQIDMALALDRLLTENDVVMVAVPYELSFTGAVVERAAEIMGATLLSVGTSNTICPVPRALELIRRYEVTALVCSPSLATQMAGVDLSLGRRPASSSIRTVLCMGEAVSPGRLGRVGDLWGARATSVFGTAATPVVAVPCGYGALHLCEHRLRATVRGATGEQLSDPAAVRGELLLAPAGPGPAQAVATGELVQTQSGSPCLCGEDGTVLTPLGRVADALPASSGPVSAVDVERVVFDFAELAPDFAWEVRDGRFQVTCAAEVGPLRGDELARSAQARLWDELGLDVTVRVLDPGTWRGRPITG